MPTPPLVVANAVQVRLLGTATGQGVINVLHASKVGGSVIDQARANTVGAAIKSAWSARFATLMTVGASLVRVGLRDLTLASQPEFLDTGAIVAGTATGDPLPAQVAACVTLRTALSGRSFRGRVYISGWDEVQNTASAVMATATSTAIVGFLNDVSTALSASALTLGVLSRPAYAYVDTRTWTLAAGQTLVETTGRGTARTGEIHNVTLISSRDARWENMRRRNNGRGGVPTLLTARAQAEPGGEVMTLADERQS